MRPQLGIALDALRPMLCERARERKTGKEKASIGVVKKNGEETLGFGVFTLRDLKAGEEIVLGQWECGTYVACSAEHSAYVSVSFSILLLLFTVGLSTIQYTLVTDGQSTGVNAPMAKLLRALSPRAHVYPAHGIVLTQIVAYIDGQERFVHLFLVKRRAAVGELHVRHKWARA